MPGTDRLIALEGTYNLRDTGGYPVLDAAGAVVGRTRWGVLLRSDALHRLSEGDLADLARRGVRLVVDLRDERELLAAPNRLDGLDVQVAHLPVLGEASPATLVTGRIDLATLYDAMVDQRGEALARAVAVLARAGDGASIVHCTAGKDRTGLVVALALRAVGVPVEAVAADYGRSAEHLAGDWAREALAAASSLGPGDELPPGVVEIVTASPEPVLTALLARVEAEHGSAAAYLVAHGLTDDDLAALRARLVEPAEQAVDASPGTIPTLVEDPR
ncbi:tyrosine-protein phosphatase [Cellulomonas sp. C5510]|nr:tyrosine-protein phosphatase [Cellulomonas sp. C5510]